MTEYSLQFYKNLKDLNEKTLINITIKKIEISFKLSRIL